MKKTPANCSRLIHHLRAERERRGWARPAVAEMVGCTASQVWAWETGINTPSLPYVVVWAESLGFRLSLDDVSQPAVTAGLSDVEDRLAAQALLLVTDIRDDVPAVHRTVRVLGRLELEQLVCVLAAMVDPSKTLAQMAWWRPLSPLAEDEVA